MEKIIPFCGQLAQVACDENCAKAWGHSNRPKIQLDDDDPDDTAYLSDGELGEAPVNPRTYEGGEGKPINKQGILNKWCVRECERCVMSASAKYNEPLKLTDFTKRVYNQPWKHLND